MEQVLSVYNTISGKKEVFKPIDPPHIGMYVCGPTVYGDPHLGHARAAIVFDVVFRLLLSKGYKVRYVRNITDVGHLENDSDHGEDKILKKARIEQLEPMEVVQIYTDRYHQAIDRLNVLHPSIEPRASGHIIEQIEMIKSIISRELAYEVNGSVYFDVTAYNGSHHYGKLSGRVLEELLENTRALEGRDEKKSGVDFALWKKAQPEHIMKWPSPWGIGFPGWHLECSVMGNKYLGCPFDIHGGGMDLMFPHHECEIAQSQAAYGCEPVKYWLHNNMITINGQKMSKSLNNFITLDALFSGESKLLKQAYSPMTIRFFILQAHYRSTLDFSNDALIAAEKGLKKMMNGLMTLKKLKISDSTTSDIKQLKVNCDKAINDDFSTPVLISHLFEGIRIINSINSGEETINKEDFELLQELFNCYAGNILGFRPESGEKGNQIINPLMKLIIDLRQDARDTKDFKTSDNIRDVLAQLKISIKDEKEGTSWAYEE